MDTSTLPAAVAEYLAANRTELFDITETLVGHDTQNPPGRTVDIVEWLETTLDETALAVERCAVDPEKPNLIVTLPGRTDRTLCFNGHLDTVPFDESDWAYDPLGERDGDRIYGRGATDMKGAVAAIVQVALAYARTETEPPVTLQFAFVSDEETGGDAKVLRHDGIPTVEFGFGTQTAHGTDEYTTTEALVRNAISYGTLPVLYERLTSADK
jgi:succinyl-diaminopimelate desuccinylase